MKEMLDIRYPLAKKIRLVMDNLNTHDSSSFYEAFEPVETRRLIERLDIHYTPKHGSWFNMAEIELSVFKKQCLDRRIANMETLRSEINVWESARNSTAKQIAWQFKTKDARIKPKKLYPNL